MIRAYLSHPIRGVKGMAATREDMEANNRRAIEFARIIRECCGHHGLDLYVPAEHDEFVIQAYELGYLTEQQILDVDVQLVQKRDLLILYAPDKYISTGMLREHTQAECSNLYIVYVFEEDNIEPIQRYLESLKR